MMHGQQNIKILSGELCVVHLYEAVYALDVHWFIPRELHETIIQLLYYSKKINTYIYPSPLTVAETVQSKWRCNGPYCS
jgi:hypothetical protein